MLSDIWLIKKRAWIVSPCYWLDLKEGLSKANSKTKRILFAMMLRKWKKGVGGGEAVIMPDARFSPPLSTVPLCPSSLLLLSSPPYALHLPSLPFLLFSFYSVPFSSVSSSRSQHGQRLWTRFSSRFSKCKWIFLGYLTTEWTRFSGKTEEKMVGW